MVDKCSYVMYRHSGHRWIGLFVGLALLWAQSKFRGGSYDGGGRAQVSCPPVIFISAKFQGGSHDGVYLSAQLCNVPPPADPNKFRGGFGDGYAMGVQACPPTLFFSAKYAGGFYDGHSLTHGCPRLCLYPPNTKGFLRWRLHRSE